MSFDAVDLIAAQWQQEKPELPLEAMVTLGRLKRCSVLYQPFLDRKFAEFDLTSWEFDVLATLRRAGAPFTLSPTELFSALLVTSGTMTHRLKTLEAKGWISRVKNDGDARQKKVRLTEAGQTLIDTALTAHVANMAGILEPLSQEQRKMLDQALKSLLDVFEGLHRQEPSVSGRLSDKTHGL